MSMELQPYHSPEKMKSVLSQTGAAKGAVITVTELAAEEPEQNPQEQLPTPVAESNLLANVLNHRVTHIVSSPYADLANQLDLRSLTLPAQLLALALTHLAPLRPDYATASYLSSFNWPEVFEKLRAFCVAAGVQWARQEFYLVIFRSKLRRDADRVRLDELDQHSHREACESGGLLKYWFGSCDAEIRNLATCIWRNREDAAAGGGGPWHRKARAAAGQMYERIFFYTHRLVIEAGAEQWRLEENVQRDAHA